MTTHTTVCVVAVSRSSPNSHALMARSTPETRYVPEIIFLRPTVSNSGPRISGPSRLPTEKASP